MRYRYPVLIDGLFAFAHVAGDAGGDEVVADTFSAPASWLHVIKVPSAEIIRQVCPAIPASASSLPPEQTLTGRDRPFLPATSPVGRAGNAHTTLDIPLAVMAMHTRLPSVVARQAAPRRFLLVDDTFLHLPDHFG